MNSNNSVLNTVLNPSTRLVANAAYTLKQWSRFAFAQKMRFQHHMEADMNAAYNSLLHFTQFAGEIGDVTESHVAEYLRNTMGISGGISLYTLFAKENWEQLRMIGFGIPVICSSMQGKPFKMVHTASNTASVNTEVAPKRRGRKPKTKVDAVYTGDPRKKPEGTLTRKCSNGRDWSKKDAFNVPMCEPINSNVNPREYYVLHDRTGNGEGPMMVRINDEQVKLSRTEHMKNGYINAIRFKYAKQCQVKTDDVNCCRLSAYIRGKYKEVARNYNMNPETMPGIKKLA